jgi:hypothetical protein
MARHARPPGWRRARAGEGDASRRHEKRRETTVRALRFPLIERAARRHFAATSRGATLDDAPRVLFALR